MRDVQSPFVGRSRRWAVVLAGGEGARLAGITTLSHGRQVPKQYWSLRGGASLLKDTLARAERVVPPERTLVVVAREHREHWQRELMGHPARNILVQPANRGTAAGLLLPALTILSRDPGATMAVLPSDHFVAHEGVLGRALVDALARAAASRKLVLLGMAPDSPETQYGWILPEGDEDTAPVRAFVEKPVEDLACALFERGALWNSFILAANVQALIERAHRSLSWLTQALQGALRSGDPAVLEELYNRLPSHDFCRDVLQGVEAGLLVHRVPPCGWTDLGTPERVAACLDATPGGVSRKLGATPYVLADALGRSPLHA